MGAYVSAPVAHCAAAAPPALAAAGDKTAAAASSAAAAGSASGSLLPAAAQAAIYGDGTKPSTSVADYMNLPSPVRYEELQREVMMSLKPDLFEGLRFDFTKPFNQNFALCHSFFLGNVEVPSQSGGAYKMAVGTYEFGANLVSQTGDMMIGRVMTDGRLTGRVKKDLLDDGKLSAKVQAQLSPESSGAGSQVMLDLDSRGSDWNGQVKIGNNQFYGLNYFQSVTPQLSVGGELFWLRSAQKSGAGFAARHAGASHVATAQVATTGLLSLAYIHRVSDKVSLAADFLWNWTGREAAASFGYDYVLRQCRLRGRVDTDGRVGALLEERLNVGVSLVLSAELDHVRKDARFGIGMTVGE